MKKGFTLVETLVAITILLVGVIGPLTIASRGISDGLFAKNQITANYLAQTAMEIIINKRNSNVINGLDAFAGFGVCGGPSMWCSVDPIDGSISSGSGPQYIVYDPVMGRYVSSETTPVGEYNGPVFTRWVQIEAPTGSDAELEVRVRVGWDNKGVERAFNLKGYIYKPQ